MNPVVGTGELKAGGETYRLVWDFNAIADAEAVTGCDLLVESLPRSGGRVQFGAAQVRGLLYACLRASHPKMTLEQAGKIVQRAGVNAVIEAIAGARLASQPDPPGGVEGEEPPAPGS